MNLSTHIETFRQEVETALRVFYAYYTMCKLLSEQRYVDLLNNNVYFWKIFLSSTQTKFFIALGRLYDNSNDAFSFQSFIKVCRENIREFNYESLEKRKLDGSSNRPDWLDSYLRGAYFAQTEDIDALSRLAKPFNKMKRLCKEIRSKVFAHAIHTDEIAISNLFEDTQLDEIESALTALWSIYRQISQLYHDGQKPTFEIEAYPYKDEVDKCVRLAVIGRV